MYTRIRSRSGMEEPKDVVGIVTRFRHGKSRNSGSIPRRGISLQKNPGWHYSLYRILYKFKRELLPLPWVML